MRLERDDGASAVEFALIAPLLFLLLFGIIEFGLGYYTMQGAADAAREAARRAAVGSIATCDGGSGNTDLKALVKSQADGASFDGVTLAESDDNGDGTTGDAGDQVVVTIKYHIDLGVVGALIPGIPDSLNNLTNAGKARIEQSGGQTSCSVTF